VRPVGPQLMARAGLLARLRQFMAKAGLLEVETSLMVAHPALEPHIEPFAIGPQGPYLNSSPEYAMKRLLAKGSGSIYQICKSFRKEEQGQRHRSEFTLLEYYVVGADLAGLMDFTDQLQQTVFNWPKAERVAYGELFKAHLGLDPLSLNEAQFLNLINKRGESAPSFLLGAAVSQEDRLDFLFSSYIEPHLGEVSPVFVFHYPPFMAALARLDPLTGQACRFEVFYKGLELGNGYFELKQRAEQRNRFDLVNQKRLERGDLALPLDEPLLSALDTLPDCAGLAMGLDRVLMIELGSDDIRETLAIND